MTAQMWQIPEDVAGDDPKCGCCNWNVGSVYLMAETEALAVELFHENERGLCGSCMAEMLAENAYTIEQPAPGGV